MRKSSSAIVGIAMSLAALVATASVTGLFAPIPYGHVEIKEVTRVGDRVTFVANFIKVKCTIKVFQVQTETLGIWAKAPYENVPPKKAKKDSGPTDRIAGPETVSISFNAGPNVDSVQIKTRHDCGGVSVDGIFAKGDLARWLAIY